MTENAEQNPETNEGLMTCPECSSTNLSKGKVFYALPGSEEVHRKPNVGSWIIGIIGAAIFVLGVVLVAGGDFSFLGAMTLLVWGGYMVKIGFEEVIFFMNHKEADLDRKVLIKCEDCKNSWYEPLEEGQKIVSN